MNFSVVLDTRPVSQIAHPRKFAEISAWFDRVAEAGYTVVIPEVVDYEVRRGLLRIPAPRQIERLDGIIEDFHFAPITRPVMQDAAHVWAEARNRGAPFTTGDRLDGNAILAAQVRALGDPAALTVITENVRHLESFVPAMRWQAFHVGEE